MTTEEKLERAIDFIKRIEKMDIPLTDIEDMVTIKAECADCGSDEIDISFLNGEKCVESKFVEQLKDDAWHLLVDLTD